MPVDIFATKGTEYLLTVVYFVLLVAVAGFLAPGAKRLVRTATAGAADALGSTAAAQRWFHPGHAWVAADREAADVVTIGLDDFAAQVVGAPDRLELPAVGAHVRQGGPGWRLSVGDRTLGMLSPVEGDVVAVNEEVRRSPALAADDPYGGGWLLKVRAPDRRIWQHNLFGGDLASVWLRHSADRLRHRLAGELGEVMADGGKPVRGFGRALAPEEWERMARDFFLTG